MQISFNSQGNTLSGHLFTAPNPQPLAFLMIQGWMGHQNVGAAQALADMGFTTMTYDMHGNGDSQGELGDFTRAEFIADAVNAYDFLKQHIAPNVAIGAIGSSFGGYTAVQLSEQRPLKCLSLRVAADYPDAGFTDLQLPQVASPVVAAWRHEPHDYRSNHTLTVLHNFTGEVQLVESERDESVPHQTIQNYANAVADKARLEYAVMRDAPHTLANDALRAEYIQLLTDWVKRFISKR